MKGFITKSTTTCSGRLRQPQCKTARGA